MAENDAEKTNKPDKEIKIQLMRENTIRAANLVQNGRFSAAAQALTSSGVFSYSEPGIKEKVIAKFPNSDDLAADYRASLLEFLQLSSCFEDVVIASDDMIKQCVASFAKVRPGEKCKVQVVHLKESFEVICFRP